MSDKVFLDSNIVVYSYSNSEPIKKQIARKLISENETVISTQVLQELSNIVTKKFKLTYSEASVLIKECIQNNKVYTNNPDTILLACQIAEKYKFSFYDSLIISSALENGCSILYSEDLHDRQIIEDRLEVVNPFREKSSIELPFSGKA